MTPDQLSLEWQKCMDSKAYFYNTYMRRPEDREITDEEFAEILVMARRIAGPKPRVPECEKQSFVMGLLQGKCDHQWIAGNIANSLESKLVCKKCGKIIVDPVEPPAPLTKCQISHTDMECWHPQCPVDTDGVTKCPLPWWGDDPKNWEEF